MRDDSPNRVHVMPSPDDERIWWLRVRRAAERQGSAGSKLMADWSHEMMRVQVPDASGHGYELVDGVRRPVTPEMFTDEYKAAQTRRLADQLGRDLGVGPYPG